MVFQPKSYKWKDGFSYSVKANVVGEVIEEIESRDGSVTREAFLDASRPDDSPTHSMFEWDDAIAAEKWRLDEARKIIVALQVTYEDESEFGTRSTPAFINIKSERKAEYVNVIDALSDQESRALIIERINRDLDQIIERNRHIEDLADILESKVSKLRKKSA